MQDFKASDSKKRTARRRPSIRIYLLLMNLILLCLLFPAVSLLFLHQEAKVRQAQLQRTIKQMRQSLESRSAALVRNMAISAGYAAAGYDFTFLSNLVGQVVAEDAEIKYCVIMDTGNRAVAHSDPAKVGSELSGPTDQKAAALLADAFPTVLSDNLQPQVHFLDVIPSSESQHAPVMEIIAPVYSGAKLFAVLRCGYSLERLASQIQVAKLDWTRRSRQFKIYLFTITAVIFTIGGTISAFFTRAFVRSVQKVSAGVSQVARGDLTHEIQPDGLVCSELQRLSEAFNSMTGQLKITRGKLDEYSKSLEQKVEARTKELKDAQATLLQQAHEAGMAEMAVGILHNIGNAITPARVWIFRLLRRTEKKSLLNSLTAALGDLEKVIPAVPSLSAHEKDKLQGIIKLVPGAIKEENALNVNDIEQIRKTIDHIKSIIELQLRYARVFGDIEIVDIAQVVEDALTLHNDALRKRKIKIVKRFSNVPPVKIEKAKLIQIVVNLIKNSYEAMDQESIEERTLTLSIHFEREPTGTVVLSVKDNGIGFSPSRSQDLFKFSYTTKEKGSGFGLHSCANFVIAHKGAISAHSEGQGKGAELIVRLPAYGNDSLHGGGKSTAYEQ